MSIEKELYYLVILVPALGLCAQWLAWRFHLPAIVLLSAIGLTLGPGLDILAPTLHSSAFVQTFIKFAVAVILFEGGLHLSWYELKDTAKGVRRLIFPGLLFAWGAYSICAYYIGQIPLALALTFGAIIVVSGPTVVIPLLRQARLKRNIASYIKWEGIVNDPLGALLAVLVFQYFVLSNIHQTHHNLLLQLFQGIIIATVSGIGLAKILGYCFEKGLTPEFLNPAIVLVCILGLFYIPNIFQDEAGLLAVTLFGLTLSNTQMACLAQIHRFHESLTMILVSCLFIILTASIDTQQILALNWHHVAMLASIIFIARPIVIFLSTINTDMTFKEKILLSWIAPRGVVAAAVAGVFAFELSQYQIAQGDLLVPLVVTLILATVVLHGFSLSWVAKKLGLAATSNNGVLIVGASLWSVQFAQFLRDNNINVMIADASWHSLKYARLAKINTYHGQVLSEEADEYLDLSEIGYVIAATNNDAYNAMICSRFGHELGRNKTYQLPILSSDQRDARDLHPSLAGIQLFSKNDTFEELMRRHYMHWDFTLTEITEQLPYSVFCQTAAQDMLPVAIVKKEGSLEFNTGNDFTPNPQDKIITYQSRVNKERRGQLAT